AQDGHRVREVIRWLGYGYKRYGQAAVLALRHWRERAMPMLRRALMGGQAEQRWAAAAALAVIDEPWSRRELTAVLDESTDHDATRECRQALRRSRSPEARRIADAWERENPATDRDNAPKEWGISPGSGTTP